MGRMSRDRGGINETLKADFEIASAANVLVVASDARSNLAVAEGEAQGLSSPSPSLDLFHDNKQPV